MYPLDIGININTGLILGLLLVILYFVSNVKSKILGYQKSTQHYLNTSAKIRSIEFSPNSIINIDSDGYIVSWNEGAHNMFGYTENEVLGKSIGIIIPDRYKEAHS